MRLVRVRPCDGACCRESPRFPTEGRASCRFLDASGRCELRRRPELIPEDSVDLFVRTCLQWPEFWPAGRGTGGCCLQWVD